MHQGLAAELQKGHAIGIERSSKLPEDAGDPNFHFDVLRKIQTQDRRRKVAGQFAERQDRCRSSGIDQARRVLLPWLDQQKVTYASSAGMRRQLMYSI
jgi:hypothetical protein